MVTASESSKQNKKCSEKKLLKKEGNTTLGKLKNRQKELLNHPSLLTLTIKIRSLRLRLSRKPSKINAETMVVQDSYLFEANSDGTIQLNSFTPKRKYPCPKCYQSQCK